MLLSERRQPYQLYWRGNPVSRPRYRSHGRPAIAKSLDYEVADRGSIASATVAGRRTCVLTLTEFAEQIRRITAGSRSSHGGPTRLTATPLNVSGREAGNGPVWRGLSDIEEPCSRLPLEARARSSSALPKCWELGAAWRAAGPVAGIIGRTSAPASSALRAVRRCAPYRTGVDAFLSSEHAERARWKPFTRRRPAVDAGGSRSPCGSDRPFPGTPTVYASPARHAHSAAVQTLYDVLKHLKEGESGRPQGPRRSGRGAFLALAAGEYAAGRMPNLRRARAPLACLRTATPMAREKI